MLSLSLSAHGQRLRVVVDDQAGRLVLARRGARPVDAPGAGRHGACPPTVVRAGWRPGPLGLAWCEDGPDGCQWLMVEGVGWIGERGGATMGDLHDWWCAYAQ